MNSLKNEVEIDLDGEQITLRPSFENLLAFEKKIIQLDSLSYELSRGGIEGKQRLLGVTESTALIFFCHEPKKYSINEIHAKVLKKGIKCRSQLYSYVMQITAGDEAAAEITENQKKS